MHHPGAGRPFLCAAGPDVHRGASTGGDVGPCGAIGLAAGVRVADSGDRPDVSRRTSGDWAARGRQGYPLLRFSGGAGGMTIGWGGFLISRSTRIFLASSSARGIAASSSPAAKVPSAIWWAAM